MRRDEFLVITKERGNIRWAHHCSVVTKVEFKNLLTKFTGNNTKFSNKVLKQCVKSQSFLLWIIFYCGSQGKDEDSQSLAGCAKTKDVLAMLVLRCSWELGANLAVELGRDCKPRFNIFWTVFLSWFKLQNRREFLSSIDPPNLQRCLCSWAPSTGTWH